MNIHRYLRKCLYIGMLGFCSQAAVFTVAVTPAYAAEKAEKVSPKVGKPLKKARELMEAKKWKEALAQTREVAAIPNKTPAEEAIVNEMLAYCMMNLNDHAGAVAVYEKMLAANQFKPEETPKRLLTISQLHLSAKNYPKSIHFAELYLQKNNGDLEVMRQLAETYYLNNDFARAETTTKSLLKTAQQKRVAAKEEWLKLLLSAQYKQDKRPEIIVTLEQLLKQYPSDQYWSNMFTYASDSSFSDRQIMIYLRLLHDRGLMDTNEYIEMAELALAVNNPGVAAAYLDEGFAKGKLGAGAQKDRETKLRNLAKQQSAEDLKTLPSLEKEAAGKPTGEALVKIGEAYLGHGQYQNAITTLSKGLQKGGIKNQDDVNINIGIAYLALNKKDDAIKAFNAVPATSKLALMSRLWAIHAGTVKNPA
ncbi:MAG: tetratricopeptide repeat protein [Cellvibrionaceae bacterium]|nr:tetratricopeptide repeat protein [Cellvibrionaceae bacterium]